MSGPSVLEYARYHGLSEQQTASDVSKYLHQVSGFQIDEDVLPGLETPSPNDLYDEARLELSYEAASRLAELTEPPKSVPWDQVLKDPFHLQKLKMEEPMLTGDHERDMRWFKRPMNIQNIINELREGCAAGCSEKDDGAAFLARCQRAAEAACSDVRWPRLESTATALATLTNSTLDAWTNEDLRRAYDRTLTEGKRPRLEPLTPLLTPTLPASVAGTLPAIPDISLEPRSEQEVALDNLMLQVEQKLEETDQICTSDSSTGSPTEVRRILAQATTTPMLAPGYELTQFDQLDPFAETGDYVSSLKLEVPLVYSPPSRSQLEHEPQHPIEGFISEFLVLPDEPEEAGPSPLTEEDFVQHLDAYQSRVREASNNEPLSVNEHTLRVQVPTMLDEARVEAQSATLDELAAGHGITLYPMTRADEARLNWVPLSRKLMQPDLQEELEVSDNVQGFLTIPNNVTQSKDLLWKEPGLRLCDYVTESDEELMVDSKLIATLRKDPLRTAGVKHPIEDARATTQQRPDSVESVVCSQQPNGRAEGMSTNAALDIKAPLYSNANVTGSKSIHAMMHRPLKLRNMPPEAGNNHQTSTPISEDGPANFSASASLASFLDLRGNKFKKTPPAPYSIHSQHSSEARHPDHSDDRQPSQATTPSPWRPLFGNLGPFSRTSEVSHEAIENSQPILAQPKEHVKVPSTPDRSSSSDMRTSPAIDAVTEARIIVMDESLIGNRSLMAMVDQQSDDSLRSIYRNLGRSPDIILNPTTCLILTNFQALKQKSLPGQKLSGSNTIQDRIRKISEQYETIFMLISITTSAATDSTSLIADFTCFCTAFQRTSTTVCPIWVPTNPISTTSRNARSHSPPDPLTAWTWRLITQHSLHPQSNMSFIDDTTLWELFLRKAGVNALAAQLMLGMLKRGDPSEGGGDVAMSGGQVDAGGGDWGLRRLVSMGAEERKSMFVELVGEKCVERLSRVLDDKM